MSLLETDISRDIKVGAYGGRLEDVSNVCLTRLDSTVRIYAGNRERATGIEPALPAWEAETKRVPLPLAQAGTIE